MTTVFPALPGQGWSVTKTPRFATRVQQAINGRELRVLDQPYPLWSWTLSYALLRDAHDTRGGQGLGTGYDELRTLVGFFLAQQGSFQPFLFDDPTDDTASGQYLGAGNSSQTQFQLVRTMSIYGFAEPVTAPRSVSAVYFDGIAQGPSTYSVNAGTGLVTFATPPPSGQIVTADFTYYFLVRFSDDTAELENFMYQLWSLKQIKLQSVFL